MKSRRDSILTRYRTFFLDTLCLGENRLPINSRKKDVKPRIAPPQRRYSMLKYNLCSGQTPHHPSISAGIPQNSLCDFQSLFWHMTEQYCVSLHRPHFFTGISCPHIEQPGFIVGTGAAAAAAAATPAAIEAPFHCAWRGCRGVGVAMGWRNWTPSYILQMRR